MAFSSIAFTAANDARAALEGDREALRLVAEAARTNDQAIETWVGSATWVETTTKGKAQPAVDRSDIDFVFVRDQEAVRNRVVKHGPHKFITPDAKAHEEDAELVANQMSKGGAFFWVNHLGRRDPQEPERQILHVSAQPTGFQALTFFDPRSFFFEPSRKPSYEMLEAYVKLGDRMPAPFRISRAGQQVTLEARNDRTVNRYVFDLKWAGNLTELFAETDDGGEDNKTSQRTTIEYEIIDRVVLPKKWSEARKGRTMGGDPVARTRELTFTKSVVNKPVDVRETSVEALGIKVGDTIRDERTGRTFEYTGKPLPATLPAGPETRRAGAAAGQPRAAAGDPADPLGPLWPASIACGVVIAATVGEWRRRRIAPDIGPIASEPWSLRSAVRAGVPKVIGVLFIFSAVAKASNASGLRAVLEFDGFPGGVLSPLITGVLLLELFIGLGLLLGWGGRGLVIATVGVLVVYSFQLGFLLLSQKAPDCSCLGLILQYRSAREGHLLGLGRNILILLALAWLLFLWPREAGTGKLRAGATSQPQAA